MKKLIYILLFIPFILNGQILTRNDSILTENEIEYLYNNPKSKYIQ